MRTLAIAALQTQPVPHDVEATWERFAQEVRSVRDLFPHLQMVVVPELMLTAEGPLLGTAGPDPKDLAQTIPGPLTGAIADLAVETGLWLVPGTIYESGQTDDGEPAVFNTAIVVSPTGEIVARYRKIFPWQPYETTTPGDRCVVFDMPGIGRVGLAICYDGSFPEIVRQLAWSGAEVVIQPTLTTTRDREMELVCARANAWTNQVFVVNLNASDPAGVGQSLIVDPEGIVRQQAGTGAEVLIDVLDLDTVTRVREFGSSGLNRPWHQMATYGTSIQLPMYEGGVIQPPQH